MKLTICLIWLAGLIAVSGDETNDCIKQCTSDISKLQQQTDYSASVQLRLTIRLH
ncbi:uncharacterized protein PHALS_08980 [Plasmopara halstedii]|uniref:RxLR-like protein n=1 Tax=Plasmopara halstedii TaxID=4781 RepID=A0A0P1ADP6_PLAHL|nr:uncharacterized protein PHALS_08980 [Plasmopara halstedii]CEG38935.1 hypothetical protein PHALS_08980 [Plasmopara halstedii]|eukprot:XP_024575304.1 hypothetical protein PHALS_08980 [Plasmopara halstedii]